MTTTNVPGSWAPLRALLPEGLALPAVVWNARHRFIVWVIAAHAVGLAAFGLAQGWGPAYSLGEAAVVAVLGAVAALRGLSRRLRSGIAALALVVSSAILVQFSGGYIEAHFHYFIVVALVALYQDYVPFLLAILYVALDHGLIGTLAPEWVYNHEEANGAPWTWAAIHAAAILGESVALLGFWAGAEQARARSDVVLDSAGEGVLGLDLQGRITFANPAAARLLAVRADDLIGTDIRPLVPDIAPVLAEGFEHPRPGILVRPDAKRVPVEWGLTPTQRNGVVLGSVLILRDATAHQALQDQLRIRTQQQAVVARLGHRALQGDGLQAFLDEVAVQVSVALQAPLCKILELEPGGAWFRLRAGVGWSPGLVGHALVPADLHSQAGYALKHEGPVIVLDVAKETRFTEPALLREHQVVSGMSVLIEGKDGPFGVLGAHARTFRVFTDDDINFLQSVANLVASAIERQRVELDLERLVERRTAQLTEANRELEAFSYTVSHDLRSPLRSIDGFSRILRDRYAGQLSPDAQTMLGFVSDGAIRMGNLIESILALSRLSRVQLSRTELDVTALATQTLEELAAKDPGRRVAWSVDPGLRAWGDAGLVRIALENLLGNAWKFTGRTPEARIRVGAMPGSSPPEFVVEDNGAGFDMANAKELFQPFHRLHEPSEFEGTGIGLATVARIVRRHGGDIRAESAPGQGARFIFSLAAPPRAGHSSEPIASQELLARRREARRAAEPPAVQA